ncbi:MAG TPA: sugar ABC transporter permease [Amycolatopsis sp.]|uniref:carbohydrate ABC transporter permease n=1 Tax=Amycolatopsis sp. TaxID=37632 RepID=UPI002B472117|nr:sugar ABC transporter permease [Amycolatopsis sp.]HKS47720.1 sugar ABC transporter permease [Amycolatopsis sp.]
MSVTLAGRTRPPKPPHGAPVKPSLRERLARWDIKVSPYVYIAPFFVVFGITGLFPLLYTAYVSLFHWEVGDDHPKFLGLDNYRELFGDGQFWHAVGNTLSIFVLSSGPQIVIAVLLAAAFNTRLRSPVGWRVGVLMPYAASLVAIGIIFSNLFGPRYGLVNSVLEAVGLDRVEWQSNRIASHLAIAAMVNWRWTGYNALIVLAAMRALPTDVMEAAVVDGAGAIRRFVSVTLPMLRPTLIFVVITSTIGGLQIFTEPKLFDAMPGSNNGGSQHQFQTVTLYLYQSAFEGFDLGYASAIAWLLFVLIVIIAVLNYVLTRRLAK